MTEQLGEQPKQFGYALARGTHHGGTAYITCALCGGRAIAMLTLNRQVFSDVRQREQQLETWANLVETDHNRSRHKSPLTCGNTGEGNESRRFENQL